MSIKQLNATYDALEDRILFRVTSDVANTGPQEFRFWLTRAKTLWLMAQVDQSVVAVLQRQHPHEQAAQIASFQQEAWAEAGNFSAPFEEASTRPLGDSPNLVHAMQLSWGNQQFNLQLQLQGDIAITLTLQEQLMTQTKLLLQNIAAQAGWVSLLPVSAKVVH